MKESDIGNTMDIVFVILNYNTYDDTCSCVNSIRTKIDTKYYHIILVDNASTDDSFDKLKEKYNNSRDITFIRNNTNLGFAKGNNVGIKFANNYFKPRYIVLSNSDVELIQSDLLTKLDAEFNNSGFALLGPMVLTANGRCDNSPADPPTIKRTLNEIKILKRERVLKKLNLYTIYCGIRFFYKTFKNKALHLKNEEVRSQFQQYQQQKVIQGCFFILSQKAFKFIDGLDESTFLYYEEPLLYLHLMHYELTTVYDPEICIYHKDGRSVHRIKKSTKKKDLFINQCYINSAKQLLNLLKKYNYD